MKHLIFVLLMMMLVPAAAQDIPLYTIQEKSIHIQTAMEESKVTIKDSWDSPCPDSIRTGDEAYRPLPEVVLPMGWLAYVAQGAMGSWNGSYAPMAIQTIDRT